MTGMLNLHWPHPVRFLLLLDILTKIGWKLKRYQTSGHILLNRDEPLKKEKKNDVWCRIRVVTGAVARPPHLNLYLSARSMLARYDGADRGGDCCANHRNLIDKSTKETCVSCGLGVSNLSFLCGTCLYCWTCCVIKSTRCPAQNSADFCHLIVSVTCTGYNNWDTEYFDDNCKTCKILISSYSMPTACWCRKPDDACRRCNKRRELDLMCHVCKVCIECTVYWPVKKQILLLRHRMPMDIVRLILVHVKRALRAYR